MGVHSEFPSKAFEILKYFCSGAERQIGRAMLDGVLTCYQASQWYPDYPQLVLVILNNLERT